MKKKATNKPWTAILDKPYIERTEIIKEAATEFKNTSAAYEAFRNKCEVKLFSLEELSKLRDKIGILSRTVNDIVFEYKDNEEIIIPMTKLCRETIDEIAKFND